MDISLSKERMHLIVEASNKAIERLENLSHLRGGNWDKKIEQRKVIIEMMSRHLGLGPKPEPFKKDELV